MYSIKNPIVSSNNVLRTVLKISVLTVLSISAVTGCQTTRGLFNKVDDGSLKYQGAEQSDPLQLPAEKETAPFIPLYPTPEVGVNTLDLESEEGKRYQLPKPYRQVPKTLTNQ